MVVTEYHRNELRTCDVHHILQCYDPCTHVGVGYASRSSHALAVVEYIEWPRCGHRGRRRYCRTNEKTPEGLPHGAERCYRETGVLK